MDIANTSQRSGELKLTQRDPKPLGIGSIQYANQGLPMCMIGNNPACITEKIVIASADLLIAILHFCLNSNKTAEISVPACPIPTHQTKFVISQAHPTVLFNPHTPIPVEIV